MACCFNWQIQHSQSVIRLAHVKKKVAILLTLDRQTDRQTELRFTLDDEISRDDTSPVSGELKRSPRRDLWPQFFSRVCFCDQLQKKELRLEFLFVGMHEHFEFEASNWKRNTELMISSALDGH